MTRRIAWRPAGAAAIAAAPPAPYEVELGGPLGERALLDGRTLPRRDVVGVACCG